MPVGSLKIEGMFLNPQQFLCSYYDDWKAQKPANTRHILFDGMRYWYVLDGMLMLGVAASSIPAGEVPQ